jgi:MFS superfamily sulfate permease-like transporter
MKITNQKNEINAIIPAFVVAIAFLTDHMFGIIVTAFYAFFQIVKSIRSEPSFYDRNGVTINPYPPAKNNLEPPVGILVNLNKCCSTCRCSCDNKETGL